MNCTFPVLPGAVEDRLESKRQRIRRGQPSYPAGAEQPADTGVYVHVAPPSLEYSRATVIPAGRFVTELPSLKSAAAPSESVSTTVAASAVPGFVMYMVCVSSVPGGWVPEGLT